MLKELPWEKIRPKSTFEEVLMNLLSSLFRYCIDMTNWLVLAVKEPRLFYWKKLKVINCFDNMREYSLMNNRRYVKIEIIEGERNQTSFCVAFLIKNSSKVAKNGKKVVFVSF